MVVTRSITIRYLVKNKKLQEGFEQFKRKKCTYNYVCRHAIFNEI